LRAYFAQHVYARFRQRQILLARASFFRQEIIYAQRQTSREDILIMIYWHRLIKTKFMTNTLLTEFESEIIRYLVLFQDIHSHNMTWRSFKSHFCTKPTSWVVGTNVSIVKCVSLTRHACTVLRTARLHF